MPSRLPQRLQPWYSLAVEAGQRHGVDPLLVLAVLDRESLGGVALKPKGPQGYGDKGHGHGLMQIDDRHHAAFLAERLADGTPAWADPARNIDKGAELLARRLVIFAGDEFLAVAAYNADIETVQKALLSVAQPATEAARRAAVDAVTTGKNYASDVLARRGLLRTLLNTPTEEPPHV